MHKKKVFLCFRAVPLDAERHLGGHQEGQLHADGCNDGKTGEGLRRVYLVFRPLEAPEQHGKRKD